MANVIDNAGTSRHARVYWQREPGGPWQGGLVVQSTRHIRENLSQALGAGKAPKHAYKIEPADGASPMPEEVKAKLRARAAEKAAEAND